MKQLSLKKDIAFIMYYPFHWYVYKNVYKHLKERSEFVIDLCMFDEKDGIKTLESMVALLEKNKVSYKILRREDYHFPSYLEEFFSQYKVMVSVWEWGSVALQQTFKILKVNTTYGVGKELTMVRPSRGLYDLILSYGERDGKLFSLSTTTVPIGNPKFDDFYQNNLDKDLLSKINLDNRKKTILYLPTHSDLSSFRDVLPKLSALSSEYNVLVKMHYYLEREESEFIQELNLKTITLFNDDTDLITLLTVCDIAISDNSSAIFDVIQADKPVLVADFWDEDFLDAQHKKPIFYKRGKGGALTYSDSIEQLIKRDGRIATFKKEDNLKQKIEESFNQDEIFSVHRCDLRKELFSYEDGECGKRGANEIINLMEGKIISKKGILFHSYETSRANNSKIYYSYPKLLEENIKYKKLLSENFYISPDIIIFDSKLDLTILTIRSIMESSPKTKIAVITESNSDVLKMEYSEIVCAKDINEYVAINQQKESFDSIFVNSGVVFNRIDFTDLLSFIKNNKELETVIVLPLFEKPLNQVKKLSLAFATEMFFKNASVVLLRKKYLYFDTSIIYISNEKFRELVASPNVQLTSIGELVKHLNVNIFLYSAFIKNTFISFEAFYEKQNSLEIFSHNFFQSEFFIQKRDRYSLPSFLRDVFKDIIKESSTASPEGFKERMLFLFTRIGFYSYLSYFRYLFYVEGLRRSLLKKP